MPRWIVPVTQQRHRVDDAKHLQQRLHRPADDYLGERQQPPLHQHGPLRELFRIVDLEIGWVVGPGRERERRVLVGAIHREPVIHDSPRPAQHPDVEVEDGARIPTGEQNGNARNESQQRIHQVEPDQYRVVRDGQHAPLDEPEPALWARRNRHYSYPSPGIVTSWSGRRGREVVG